MNINYNDINNLINFLYEFVYNSNNETYAKYTYVKLNPSKINLNQLIHSEKDNENLINSIKNLKLLDIFSNLSDDEKLKKIVFNSQINENFNSIIVLQKFDDNLKDTSSIIDVYYEFFINQIISQFVIVDKIPFYLLNISNYDFYLNDLKKFDVDKYFYLNNETDKKSKFALSVYENYNDLITMKDYLQEELSNEEIANLLFQVLFSYAYISDKLINFRHNNFIIDSFFVQKLKEKQSFNFVIGDVDFSLKTNIICKLYNYRMSQMAEFKNIYKSQLDNPSYDIYCFFKSILDFTYKTKKNYEKIKIIISNFITTDLIDQKIIKEELFLNNIVNTIIPLQILSKNNFFVSFISMKNKSVDSTLSKSHRNKTIKYHREESSATEKSLTSDFKTKKLSKKRYSKSSREKGMPGEDEEVETVEFTEESEPSESVTEQVEIIKPKKKHVHKHKKDDTSTSTEDEDEEDQANIIEDSEKLQQDITDRIEGDDDDHKTPDSDEGSIQRLNSKIRKLQLQLKKKQSLNRKTSKKSSKKNKHDDSLSSLSVESADMNTDRHMNKKVSKNPLKNVLRNINDDSLIAVPAEMQHMFDLNKIANANISANRNNNYSSDGAEPKIMDRGIENLMSSGRFSLPMIPSGMSMGPMGSMGMGMGSVGMGMGSMGMGSMSALGPVPAMPQGLPMVHPSVRMNLPMQGPYMEMGNQAPGNMSMANESGMHQAPEMIPQLAQEAQLQQAQPQAQQQVQIQEQAQAGGGKIPLPLLKDFFF